MISACGDSVRSQCFIRPLPQFLLPDEHAVHFDGTIYISVMSRLLMKLVPMVLWSSGILLLLTSVAKIISATGSARALVNADPILFISFRSEFFIIGCIELIVGSVCLIHKSVGLRAGLVAWLSTAFAVYRVGLWAVGWHKPCACLGNFTGALGIPPQGADTAMKIILAYLLIGSYATLFWLWRQRKN